MSKIVVVGVNHAGTACINTILDNYSNESVVAFDGNSNISFLGCGMALWIGRQIKGPEGLFYSSKEKLEEKGATIHMECAVSHIDFEQKKVFAKDAQGKEYEECYDKLILASGSLPIIPDLPGKDLENVQQVKLFQNAKEVIEKLEHEAIQDIVVVGAGYIGVELAEAFKRVDKNVTLIDIADTTLSGYYDPDFTCLMDKTIEEHGIKLALNQKVVEIKGTTKCEAVVTDQATYKADMVILAIGFRPNTSLGADHLNLFRNGAYEVDEHQQTSIPDVYAIGDCATVYDNASDSKSYIALATNAVRSGIVAAHNACGTPLASIGVQGSNAISVFGLNLVSTGMSLKKALALGFDATFTEYEDYQKASFIESDNEKVRIKIVYDNKSRVILGAQLASRYDISLGIHMFSLAIQEKVTIDKLKLLDTFFLPHFNQPYNYITMAALNAK
ncbi:MAG: FAD-dependent oxidoreductase [bacterium]|nr:FAD-dependent oxidoreductase [bacterium]